MSDDENLFFSNDGPVTVNAPQPFGCTLGHVIYAGTKWNSQATYAHAPAPEYLRPTPHYLLVYTLEGEADYRDDTGVNGIMRRGSLMWTIPGVNQSYGPRPGVRWSEFFLWFGGPVFDLWQEAGFPGSQSRHLTLNPVEVWLPRLVRLVQPSLVAEWETPLVRLCELQAILAEALRLEAVNDDSSGQGVWREEACRRLSEGTLTSPPLEEVALSMRVSYSLFRKRFLTLTGRTPGQFRAEEIIRRASHRLLETDESVAMIARHFRFHDPFHFSRRFKQILGMSPTDFRRQARSFAG